jgi:hypothetical protein
MPDDTEKYRKWVDDNFASDAKEQLFDIYKEALYDATNDPSDQNGAGRISKTIAKASTLLARLVHDQEKTAKKLLYLTWALAGLTFVLLLFTVALYYDTHKLVEHENLNEHRELQKPEPPKEPVPVVPPKEG